jgi:hypothetical protein
VVGCDRQAVGHLDDRQRRLPRQQLRQVAGLRGVQVLHQDECHARGGRQVREELRERLPPAGGSADADDGKRTRGRRALAAGPLQVSGVASHGLLFVGVNHGTPPGCSGSERDSVAA